MGLRSKALGRHARGRNVASLRRGIGTMSAVLLALSMAGTARAEGLSAAAEPVRRFLALGDSYTIGEGVAAEERWPELLVGLLAARGVAVSPPRVIARTGWTTRDLTRALDAERPVGPFDIVSLMIGVNDQFRGDDVDGYAARFETLLGRAVGRGGRRGLRACAVGCPRGRRHGGRARGGAGGGRGGARAPPREGGPPPRD